MSVRSVTPLQQQNMDVVAQIGASIRDGFADSDSELFADGAVFHFFNAQLPHLAGDHTGFDSIRRLFKRLNEESETGFVSQPHSLSAYGDELVVASATHTLTFGGSTLEVDAVVVWRVLDGRVHEVWDIPAINTVRSVPGSASG